MEEVYRVIYMVIVGKSGVRREIYCRIFVKGVNDSDEALETAEPQIIEDLKKSGFDVEDYEVTYRAAVREPFYSVTQLQLI